MESSNFQFQNYASRERINEYSNVYRNRKDTDQPALGSTIDKFLSVGPLAHEFVRGIELGSQTPLSEPERSVTVGDSSLQAVQIWQRI